MFNKHIFQVTSKKIEEARTMSRKVKESKKEFLWAER